ncbi:glycosyltransferase [Streptomyces polychromogenes]|uniref:D-inositol 3-phosphate glycosyltransferase n=1 Tax=Streptomyces polychromogenes TaxID=67342 RepID=A0ABP3FM20_9ACTN
MTRIGLLTTYPPQVCGIANFSATLRDALPARAAGAVVALEEPDGADPGTAEWPPEVCGVLRPESPASCIAAARILNREDVALVQHEFGIYGGPSGVDALRVVDLLTVPAIVVIHTVLDDPADHARAVLNRVCRKAAAVVVMSQDARARLSAGYDVPDERIHLIPHGVAPALVGLRRAHDPPAAENAAPTLLTWGLLRPAKGIRWAIAALPLLRGRAADARYVVAGRTHPRLIDEHGDTYRRRLAAHADRLGVAHRVSFDDRFLSPDELRLRLQRASCVVLPYESADQATSGVLAEAIAAGVPVVATAFPHATELLTAGRGTVVPHRDPTALADAVTALLSEESAPLPASCETPQDLSWPAVAARYHRLATDVLTTHAASQDTP